MRTNWSCHLSFNALVATLNGVSFTVRVPGSKAIERYGPNRLVLLPSNTLEPSETSHACNQSIPPHAGTIRQSSSQADHHPAIPRRVHSAWHSAERRTPAGCGSAGACADHAYPPLRHTGFQYQPAHTGSHRQPLQPRRSGDHPRHRRHRGAPRPGPGVDRGAADKAHQLSAARRRGRSGRRARRPGTARATGDWSWRRLSTSRRWPTSGVPAGSSPPCTTPCVRRRCATTC